MRLYRINSAMPYFVGTQAEAKRDARMAKSNWELVDVPTDKEGLMEFLNAHAVVPASISLVPGTEAMAASNELLVPETAQDQQDEAITDAVIADEARTVPQHRLAERAAFLGTSEEIALLTDRIGELDGWPLGQVALATASRLKELAE